MLDSVGHFNNLSNIVSTAKQAREFLAKHGSNTTPLVKTNSGQVYRYQMENNQLQKLTEFPHGVQVKTTFDTSNKVHMIEETTPNGQIYTSYPQSGGVERFAGSKDGRIIIQREKDGNIEEHSVGIPRYGQPKDFASLVKEIRNIGASDLYKAD